MSDDYDDVDGDDAVDGSEYGTINRPLVPTYAPNWMRKPVGKRKATWDPTVRWGDRVELTVGNTGIGAGLLPVTQDLLNVTLPKARSCQVHFHAAMLEIPIPGPPSLVVATTVELNVGVGSQMTRVRHRFAYWPMSGPSLPPGQPLDLSWTIPMNNVRGRVTVEATNVKLELALWLVPLLDVE